MQPDKLIENYARVPVNKISSFAHDVVRSTTDSEFIADGAKTVAPLLKSVTTLDKFETDHVNPDAGQRAFRDELRADVLNELGRAAKTLNLAYPGNGPALISSGLTPADRSGTASKAGSARPTTIEILDSKKPGFLTIHYLTKPVKSVQIINLVSTDEALPEEQWTLMLGGGRTRDIGPFKKGTLVGIKSAGVLSSTTEPEYSEVVWHYVQTGA